MTTNQVADIQFNQADFNAGAVPTLNGVGDTNAIRTGRNIEGAINYLPAGTGGRLNGMGTITLSASGRTPASVGITGGSTLAPNGPTFDVWLTTDPTNIGSPVSQGAIRFVASLPTGSSGNAVGIVAGYSTSTLAWTVRRSISSGWLVTSTGGNSVGTGTPNTVRVEIQWDTSQTPSLIVRLYANDGTTTLGNQVRTVTPTDGTINMLRFGDFLGTSGSATWKYGEIEVWTTRDGDSTFTNTWTTAQSTSYMGAPKGATYSPPANYSAVSDVVPVSPAAKVFIDQPYGKYNRKLDLYIPNGTPSSPNGYPVVLWAHSGFFVSGTRKDIVDHWRDRLLNAGYAVATIEYMRGVLAPSSYSAYGTSDPTSGATNAYGRYPSFIVDYKLAAVRLRDKFSQAQAGTTGLLNDNGYGIDGTKMFATGYSAGGYIALGAALTRDLTSDGTGTARNLTLAGNSLYNIQEDGSTSYTGADPTFLGAYVYAAPISMKTAMDTDWSHNLTNATLFPPVIPSTGAQTNAGPVHIAARAFMGTTTNSADPSGTSFANTDMTNLIAQQNIANPANLSIPVRYVKGSADYLVSTAHEALLASAVSGTAISYQGITSIASHGRTDDVYDFAPLQTFLDTYSGVTPAWKPRGMIF